MTMEQLIKAIDNQKELIRVHKALLSDIKYLGVASISCRGTWSCAIDVGTATGIIRQQLDDLETELGRLEEAKKAGEITMEGWLNQSKG